MGAYPDAADRYMRLAFKAQSKLPSDPRSASEAASAARADGAARARQQWRAGDRCRSITPSRGGRGIMANQSNNATQPHQLGDAPRCLARTRAGGECRSPAMRGKRRCRMHGGANPGAPAGNRNARKHGGYSASTMAAARYLKMIARLIRGVDA